MSDERTASEKKYLVKVQQAIQDEIEFQNREFVEIPSRYKGRYSDVKWGDEDLVKTLQDGVRARLKKLEKLSDNPYFGRIDFLADESSTVARFYIGKTSITENDELLTLDWRAPICTLYYDQSLGRVSYEAPKGAIEGELKLKSQILISNGELVHVKDTDLVTADELLIPFLTTNADARLKNIIASIQEEQNGIIREGLHKNLIIQGVAGSGKTTVALHRIAFLIYNNKTVSAKNFAIIGPNKYFLNYISALLPDLDTENITQFTFEEIITSILDDIKVIPTKAGEDTNECLKYKSSLEFKEAINRYLIDFVNSNLSGGIIYDGYELFSESEIKDFFGDFEKFSSTASFLQKNFIQRVKNNYDNLESAITAKYREQINQLPKGDPKRLPLFDKMDEIRKELEKGCAPLIKKYFKGLSLSVLSLYKGFISQVDKYVDLDSNSSSELKKNTLKSIKSKEFPIEDLPALMYLYIMTTGSDIPEFRNFVHLTIDEAQDFGLFHYYIIERIFKKCNVSIFGDISQAIYPTHSIEDWNELNTKIFNSKCEVMHLDRSYRTTMEITNAANSILGFLNMNLANPVIRTGLAVEVSQTATELDEDAILDLIQKYLTAGYQSIGIICRNVDEIARIQELFNKYNINSKSITSNDSEYDSGICILTSSLAKGLEFDVVLITDASEEKYSSTDVNGMKNLYVAMTRALHRLDILYSGDLTKPLTAINKNHDISSSEIKLTLTDSD